MNELKDLKDIKGIVEVNTFNPLWLLLILLLVLIVIALVIYYKKRRKKRRRFKLSAKELAKQRVENIDWSDAKSIAYTFSQDVAEFVDESNKSQYNEILKELDEYKYKKEVPNMDSKLKDRIKKFIKGIKWEG